MKQIDARPEDYRTQNARGRWVENIDRRFCRWASLIGFGCCAMAIFSATNSGAAVAVPAVLFGFVAGLSSGVLLTMSFWPTAR